MYYYILSLLLLELMDEQCVSFNSCFYAMVSHEFCFPPNVELGSCATSGPELEGIYRIYNNKPLDLGKLCFGSATEHIVFVRSVKVGLVTTITRS